MLLYYIIYNIDRYTRYIYECQYIHDSSSNTVHIYILFHQETVRKINCENKLDFTQVHVTMGINNILSVEMQRTGAWSTRKDRVLRNPPHALGVNMLSPEFRRCI